MAFVIPIGYAAKKVIDSKSEMLGSFKTRGDLKNDLFCLQEERDYFQGKFLEQISEIKSLKDELKQSKKEILRLRNALMESEMASNNNNQLPDQITATPKQHNGRVALTASCSDSYDDDEEEEIDSESQRHIAERDDASSLTTDEIDELNEQDDNPDAAFRTPSKKKQSNKGDDDNDEEEEEEEDVRKSAEKLLQWASYRSRTSVSNSQRSKSITAGDGTDHSSVMSPSVLTSGSARQSLLGKMIETMDSNDENDNDYDNGDDQEEKKEDSDEDPNR